MASGVDPGDGNRGVQPQSFGNDDLQLCSKEGRAYELRSKKNDLTGRIDLAIDIYTHGSSVNKF